MKKNPTKAVELMLRLVVYQTIESVLGKLVSNSVDCRLFLSPLFEDIVNLGGGFKYYLFSFLNDPILLIFFKWVETTN